MEQIFKEQIFAGKNFRGTNFHGFMGQNGQISRNLFSR